MQQKEKKMNNYNYYVTIFYIENNNTANETFTFDNYKEYQKFFNYILNLRYNENSNIYDFNYGHALKVSTMKEATDKLLKWGDVLLPGADENIDISDMTFEEA